MSELNVLQAYLRIKQKANATPEIAKKYILPMLITKNIGNQTERKHYAQHSILNIAIFSETITCCLFANF
jgi:hypothetical protein